DVTDFGETRDLRAYLIMELVDGQPLDQVIAEQAPLPLLRALAIVRQVAGALAAAHAKGIIHRDLKPENVMLEQRAGAGGAGPERDFVKLLDFGAAKVADEVSTRSEPAGFFGTPEYMAPELAGGVAGDARVDIYALGVLFYEMVA